MAGREAAKSVTAATRVRMQVSVSDLAKARQLRQNFGIGAVQIRSGWFSVTACAGYAKNFHGFDASLFSFHALDK